MSTTPPEAQGVKAGLEDVVACSSEICDLDGVKVPDFGHRVYRTEDPRAKVLRRFAKVLSEQVGDTRWYDISTEIERVMRANTRVYPNVDFYSALVYHLLGIPTELFTPVFAISRITGWTAHILEQWSNNRLIRPRAEYTGAGEMRYVPMDERG